MQEYQDIRNRFRAALVGLAEFIRVDATLSSRLEEARRDFFAGMEPREGRERDQAAQRFLEWFALERPVAEGTGAPIHAFLALGCPGLDPGSGPSIQALCDSLVGVFLVDDLDEDSLELEEAVTRDRFQVLLPATEHSLDFGDTLIGRLVPIPDQPGWWATDAVERIPGHELFTALRDDAEQTRLERGLDRLPRLAQVEVERLLRAQLGTPQRHAVAALEKELAGLLTVKSSTTLPSVAEVREAFRQAESPGQVIGPLLELLAFHTEVDLDHARRLLIELGNLGPEKDRVEVTGSGTIPVAETDDIPVAELGPRLVAELEAGRERGEDLGHLFDRLERMIDGTSSGPEPEGPPAEIRWETEDLGELEGLLEEYLWDSERQGRPLADGSRERLRRFVAGNRELGVLTLQAIDDLLLAARLVEPFSRGEAQACHDLLADLSAFEDWLGDEQELCFGTSVAAFAARLAADELRLQGAARRLVQAHVDREARLAAPDYWHVRREDGGLALAGRRERRPVGEVEGLEPGDIVLGRLGPKGFVGDCILVPALLARALAPSDDD